MGFRAQGLRIRTPAHKQKWNLNSRPVQTIVSFQMGLREVYMLASGEVYPDFSDCGFMCLFFCVFRVNKYCRHHTGGSFTNGGSLQASSNIAGSSWSGAFKVQWLTPFGSEGPGRPLATVIMQKGMACNFHYRSKSL